MAIRKYQKAHLCKHIEWTGNVVVFVKSSCPKKHLEANFVYKSICRECEHFEMVDVIDRLNGESEGEK